MPMPMPMPSSQNTPSGALFLSIMHQITKTWCDCFICYRTPIGLLPSFCSDTSWTSIPANHQYILRLFVGFALSLGPDYSAPTQVLIVAFIKHLACTQQTAAAVLSTIGTLKGVLHCNNINTLSFSITSVSLMMWSIKINKRTPAVQRPALMPAKIRLVLLRFTDTCLLRTVVTLFMYCYELMLHCFKHNGFLSKAIKNLNILSEDIKGIINIHKFRTWVVCELRQGKLNFPEWDSKLMYSWPELNMIPIPTTDCDANIGMNKVN